MLDVVPVAQRSGRGHCDLINLLGSILVAISLQRTSCSKGHCDIIAAVPLASPRIVTEDIMLDTKSPQQSGVGGHLRRDEG